MVEVSPGHGTVPALYLQVPPADRRPTISVMSKPEPHRLRSSSPKLSWEPNPAASP